MLDYSKPIPKEYWKKTANGGVLVEDHYGGKTLMAYLPFGFHRDKQYDIFYFKMGMGNTAKQFWSFPPYTSHFEYVIDNLIDRCIIKPCIIISIDGEREDGWLQYNALGLVKYVESKVRSFADRDMSPANLIKTAGHRALGGWSLGSIESEEILKNTCRNDYYKMFGFYDIQSGYTAKGMDKISKEPFVGCVAGSADDPKCVAFTKACAAFDTVDKAQIVPGYTHAIQFQVRYFYNAIQCFA